MLSKGVCLLFRQKMFSAEQFATMIIDDVDDNDKTLLKMFYTLEVFSTKGLEQESGAVGLINYSKKDQIPET